MSPQYSRRSTTPCECSRSAVHARLHLCSWACPTARRVRLAAVCLEVVNELHAPHAARFSVWSCELSASRRRDSRSEAFAHLAVMGGEMWEVMGGGGAKSGRDGVVVMGNGVEVREAGL